ncbi:ATP-binding cassette domain-containing protein [Falsiroseomonas sp. HW251]|uniref:branched-chain amino acid ABC transporter ATP-binding protein/permease n=1 Tax=Falsiroseomonas sp. HW251 TaxID=3390998 RepID=UPI003D319032
MSGALRSPVLWMGIALAAITAAMLATGAPVGRVTQIAIYVLYGAGVNLLIAYTGLVPFGASVFFGTGTYAAALFMLHVSGNELVGLVFTLVWSAAAGLVLGVIVLRRRGLYFSLLTLAASQIAFEVVFRWTSFTGGENGLQNVPRPLFPDALSLHLFTLAVLLGSVFVIWRFVHAPFGRALQGIRDNEARMASLGYDTWRLKLGAFALSGTIVGLAGGLLALLLQGAYANNLSWQHAADALLMVVLGGVHHVLGVLWGAVTFILLEDVLSAKLENWWLVFAPAIMVFALAAPEGLHGLFRRLTGHTGWTLVRAGIPPRPATIAPFATEGGAKGDEAPVLTVRGLTKSFGSLTVAQDLAFEVMPRRLHSIIGPNGAGKTTLFNMLSGVLRPDSGAILFCGGDITDLPVHRRARLGLGRSFQIVSVFPHLSVFENVRLGVQARSEARHAAWRDAYRLEAVNARTWSLLAAVGLQDRAEAGCASLAHGERRLLDIAVTLATDAELLLLDEPLAGLAEADRVIVARLIRRLADSHAVLLIEHDLDRVVSISDRITVLHQGRLIADGAPAEVVRDPAVVAAYLGAHGAPAVQLLAAPALSAGPVILLDVRGLVAGYGGSKVLDGIDLQVRPGEAVAVLGRNGVGKTTLLRALTGSVPITAGEVTFEGATLAGLPPFAINRRGISLVPEGRRLFPNLTVLENLRIAARPGGMSIEQACELFPRLAERARSRAENLSGGERQMCAAARALVQPSRLVLLDEPFEGLSPAIVAELSAAIMRLRGERALILVEHQAEKLLPLVDRAYVLVNGRVAFAGNSAALAADHALQARLLGMMEADVASA